MAVDHSAGQAASADEHAKPEPASEERPVFGYAVLVATFGAVFGSALAGAARGNGLPDSVAGRDIVVTGLATHKLSRLIAKDKVTSPLRAPFTRLERDSADGAIEEKPRGRGVRRAIGELVTCPYCLSQWIAAAFAVGMIVSPRLTRVLASMWAGQAIADAAHIAYVAAKKRS